MTEPPSGKPAKRTLVGPIDHGVGVVELHPFEGDPFDGQTKRRWAVVRFAEGDHKSWFPLKEFAREDKAREWLALNPDGREGTP
jgi:hypothetical protein